ncbi:pyridoxal phosphate-dependent aminotransferase family protein [Marinomonas sp. 5E14-1]|uniref:aminotransferase class I/II-fold pyridoxal phosphate-dependent enzyme n=1 Tax=Marinomonas sp. 5E14-1 TaxID=3153922 RepID=UPI0032664441
MKLTPFSGNDYLGLANDNRLIESVVDAVRQYGISPMSSRFSYGLRDIHVELEEKLAAFYGEEKAVILGAGYHGGPVFFHAAAEMGYDHVLCDINAHANMMLGIRGASLGFQSYKHLDLNDLEEKLRANSDKRIVVATDGIFGISGEIPDLKAMAELCEKYHAKLFIDDAHGVFANGQTGRGVAQACGLQPGDAIIMGSMSKALGCTGGFIVGSADWIAKCLRSPLCRGTAITAPAIASACSKSIDIIVSEPQLREALAEDAKAMRAAAKSAGIAVVTEDSPVVALAMADEFQAQKLSEAFKDAGLLIPYFKYPSEPRHQILRTVACSTHKAKDLETYKQVLIEFQNNVTNREA